jgi:mono/diheme cytochrome c family protein
LIPYELNVTFWSDGAEKKRWMALPGTIAFSPTGEWQFPNGTVFVKHFEIATDETHPTQKRRLETRLLVRDDTGGIYGVTYRWRPDNSDADRVDEARLEPIEIKTASGVRKQNWYFPSPADCRTCHTPAAGLVLGVKTRQLNCTIDDRATGAVENQLRAWNRLHLFNPPIDDRSIDSLPRLARADDPKANIENRARSLLDANCSNCHRPGGVAGFFDARYDTPLAKQNLINGPVLINLGLDHARLIAPNDTWRSIILARLTMLEQPKMPPLAHETIDRQSVALIEQWIRSLPGPKVLPPVTLSPAGGEFSKPVQVELRHPEPGVTIRYTLDGSVPTSSAAVYEKPLVFSSPTTLRARAFKAGMTNSITVQETYIVGEP